MARLERATPAGSWKGRVTVTGEEKRVPSGPKVTTGPAGMSPEGAMVARLEAAMVTTVSALKAPGGMVTEVPARVELSEEVTWMVAPFLALTVWLLTTV